MSVTPVVRHLIAFKKSPTMEDGDPSVHQILHAIKPKAPFEYPVWMAPFFLFAMLADGQGICELKVEIRLVRLDEEHQEEEVLVGGSDAWHVDLGRAPLRVQSFSFMLPAVLLPQAGVYRVYLIGNDEEIGFETLHSW